MKTYIAFDNDTLKVKGFLQNDYTALEEVQNVFKDIENCTVLESTVSMIPLHLFSCKVKIENDKVIGYELIKEV